MIDTLDLSRHAVFEASAGTGKTYTIMQLTLRLLRERRCSLDEILIVTFTEKATGELKDRLRRELEAAIDGEPENAALLQSQLDRLDRAAISTIHGFCKRLLQDYAADLGQDFQADVVMEPPLRIEALREVQRKDWHAHFGNRLPDVLRAAGYTGGGKWETAVRSILDKYRPESGHRLVPATPPELSDAAAMRQALVAFTVDKVRNRIGETKRERGVICFDDQIERVASGLDPATNTRAQIVIDALRRQYRFAIVDEFQDTDPRQWDIFRRLFLTESPAGPAARLLPAAGLLDAAEPSRLIVVGDPKQAIYGFRGADLPTYQRATLEMTQHWNAAEFPLAVNWRSSSELIAGLNCFFGKGEFFPPEGKITYTPVAAAPQRRAEVVTDASGRPPITIVDVNGEPKSKAAHARLAFARFTAREIDRLLHGDGGEALLSIRKNDKVQRLSARDICVLVFKHAEANAVKAALARRRIPYSHYKAAGVRRTPEARDLKTVLKALAHPDEDRYFTRALLTMFFRISPCELLACDVLPAEHPARVLFDRWRFLAERRQWSELFASLLEETGVLFHDRDSCDYDRRIANLKHLMGGLLQAGYQSNLDMYELLEMFDVADDEEDESDDYQPQETDEPRVQIMTIFAAKGLEYPIVFLAGGFTDDKRRNIAYRDDDGRLVFDVPYILGDRKKKDWRDARIDADRLDELRRLSYVALTRAQFKLYLPMMGTKHSAWKCAVSKVLTPTIERSGLAATEWATVIEPADNSTTPLRKTGAVPTPAATPLTVDPLLPEFDAAIGRRRTKVQSFTAMHREAKREHADAFGEKPVRLDEVVEPIAEPSDPFRGPLFGEMVHEVFERVDFAAVKAAPREADLDGTATARLIDEYVTRYLPRLVTRAADGGLFEGCRRVMRGMVWNALRTPLTPLGGMLCELPPGDRLREIEFLYPDLGRSTEGALFYKGFIDLVFRWKNAIYLLDWKTNALPGYDRANLEIAMADAGYRLQYELYWEALTRWLAQSPASSKYRMGGVLYLFLRGMNGADDSRGVYFVPADQVQSRSRRDG